MRTMLSCYLIIMAVVLTHAVAVGDEKSHRKAAETLLIVTNVDRAYQRLSSKCWRPNSSKIRSSRHTGKSCSGF